MLFSLSFRSAVGSSVESPPDGHKIRNGGETLALLLIIYFSIIIILEP